MGCPRRPLPTSHPAPRRHRPRLSRRPAHDGVVRLRDVRHDVHPAPIEEDGRALVSGRLLAEIVKALPNKPVTLQLDGQVIHVCCGASTFRLLTMPVDDFPALPVSGASIGTVPAAGLAHAIAQVAIAASRDDTLPLLTGIRVEATPGLLTFLATDRYRLTLRELPWSGDATEDFLIRAKTLTDAAKNLHGEVAISRHATNGVIALADRDRKTTPLLIDGDYPNVRRFFPDATPATAVVNVAELMGAVKRVALVAERSTPVLVFTAGDVTVEAGQGDDATASESVPAALTGDDNEVAFSPQFLLDGLAALDTEDVEFGFTHPNKPVLFTGRNSDGQLVETFRYLLVPIRFG